MLQSQPVAVILHVVQPVRAGRDGVGFGGKPKLKHALKGGIYPQFCESPRGWIDLLVGPRGSDPTGPANAKRPCLTENNGRAADPTEGGIGWAITEIPPSESILQLNLELWLSCYETLSGLTLATTKGGALFG